MQRIKLILFIALIVIPQIVSSQYLEEIPKFPIPELGYDKELNQYELSETWYENEVYFTYYFGQNSKTTSNPLYIITETEELDLNNINFVIESYITDPNYSDFRELKHVIYEDPKEIKSVEDIFDKDLVVEDLDAIINAPIVMPGATLEDPVNEGEPASILPLQTYYLGQIVEHHVFDADNANIAELLNELTRTDEFAPKINVTESIQNHNPIYYFNNISSQVKPGLNSGGPWNNGQRNILKYIPSEKDYSPQKKLLVIKQLPLGYKINNVSKFNDISKNGFNYKESGVVNIPQLQWEIDPELREKNLSPITKFEAEIIENHFKLSGSYPSAKSTFVQATYKDTVVAVANSNVYGGYTLTIPETYLEKPLRIIANDTVIGLHEFNDSFDQDLLNFEDKIPNYWPLILGALIAILSIVVLSKIREVNQR